MARRGSVLALLEGLIRDGKTVLTVTPERDVAGRVDWLTVMADGRVQQQVASEARHVLVNGLVGNLTRFVRR